MIWNVFCFGSEPTRVSSADGKIKLSLSLKTKDVFVVLGSNYKKIYDVINKYNITIIKNNSWENGIGSSISTGIKKVILIIK